MYTARANKEDNKKIYIDHFRFHKYLLIEKLRSTNDN
jgi:hypothetical protein